MTAEKSQLIGLSALNAGLGLLPRIDAHIRQLSPHIMRRDGAVLLREARDEIAKQRALIADIKAWDVAQYMTLPLDLRERVHAVVTPNVQIEGLAGTKIERSHES